MTVYILSVSGRFCYGYVMSIYDLIIFPTLMSSVVLFFAPKISHGFFCLLGHLTTS